MKDVGKMASASHIVFIDFTRYEANARDYSFEDVTNKRLVDVELGTILAVHSEKTKVK